jgi:hypothetical protein
MQRHEHGSDEKLRVQCIRFSWAQADRPHRKTLQITDLDTRNTALVTINGQRRVFREIT